MRRVLFFWLLVGLVSAENFQPVGVSSNTTFFNVTVDVCSTPIVCSDILEQVDYSLVGRKTATVLLENFSSVYDTPYYYSASVDGTQLYSAVKGYLGRSNVFTGLNTDLGVSSQFNPDGLGSNYVYNQGFIGSYGSSSGWNGNGFMFTNTNTGSKVLGCVVNGDTLFFGSVLDNQPYMTVDPTGAYASYATGVVGVSSLQMHNPSFYDTPQVRFKQFVDGTAAMSYNVIDTCSMDSSSQPGWVVAMGGESYNEFMIQTAPAYQNWNCGGAIYAPFVIFGNSGNTLIQGGNTYNSLSPSDNGNTLQVMGNVTADYYFGDGSHLNNLNTWSSTASSDLDMNNYQIKCGNGYPQCELILYGAGGGSNDGVVVKSGDGPSNSLNAFAVREGYGHDIFQTKTNGDVYINDGGSGSNKFKFDITNDRIEVGGDAGITDTSSYWLCSDSNCITKCQVQIHGGIITGCV